MELLLMWHRKSSAKNVFGLPNFAALTKFPRIFFTFSCATFSTALGMHILQQATFVILHFFTKPNDDTIYIANVSPSKTFASKLLLLWWPAQGIFFNDNWLCFWINENVFFYLSSNWSIEEEIDNSKMYFEKYKTITNDVIVYVSTSSSSLLIADYFFVLYIFKFILSIRFQL